ncbi:restriction endonuclease subunit S [Cesiribacter sp. SM1]|uniref:restriction endonuclease subunit S n=1 Tax=Cesiribacter sp. SM1 TaxID=2861196 RepID=UPI001CD3B992|nr:restriction endonuclease subunit S [Cesiribacter sp. SM1]
MNWKKCSFKNFIQLQRGFDLTRSSMAGGEFPVVGSNSVIGFHKEFKVEGPGVITGRSGTLGEVQYIQGKYWPHNTSLWVKDFKNNEPRFVYYKLQTLDLKSYNGGGAVPTLNRNNLDNIEIIIPPLPTQKKIAAILSTYDDLIENNLKRIALLEKSARLLYEEWFVRLRFPGHEQAKIVDGVPERWEKGTVKEILELQRGFDLPTQSRDSEGTVPIFASTGIVGYHSKAKVAGPGVVTGRSGTIGKVSYIETDFWPLNTTLWVKKYHQGGPLFAYQFLQTLSLEKFAGGAAVPSLDRKIAHAISIIIPPADLVTRFEQTVKPIQDQIQKLQFQNEKLKQARNILLPKLINGEITV